MLEFSSPPGVTSGFASGGTVKVIDTATETLVGVLPTPGYSMMEMSLDRLGDHAWVPLLNGNGSDVMQYDVRRRSPLRNTPMGQVGATNGLLRCPTSTADGATVVAIGPGPSLITIDTRTGSVLGAPVSLATQFARRMIVLQ